MKRPGCVLGWTLTAALLLAPLAGPVPAQNDDASAEGREGRPLAEKRWSERSYGLSLRPPVGTKTLQQTADERLLRLAGRSGKFTLSVSVKRSNSKLTIEKVLGSARQQLKQAQGTAEVLAQKRGKLAGRPAGRLYAKVPQADGSTRWLGQAIMQIDAQTFAVIESRCAFGDRQTVRPTFDAVLGSLRMVDPKKLQQQRKAALERGHQWRSDLSAEQLHEALFDEPRFYRLVADGNDIGYMRVHHEQAEKNGEPGVRVRVNTRVVRKNLNIDSEAKFFLSDDDTLETWSIKTTRRPRGGADSSGGSGDKTFVQTGIRTDNQIEVSFNGPGGQSDRKRFRRPSKGYLSQVEAWLLPHLVPIEQPTTYGFYSYSSRDRTLSFRTDKIIPTLDGFTVETRLQPNAEPLKAKYNGERELIEKQLAPGRKQIPAEPSEIKQRWRR